MDSAKIKEPFYTTDFDILRVASNRHTSFTFHNFKTVDTLTFLK